MTQTANTSPAALNRTHAAPAAPCTVVAVGELLVDHIEVASGRADDAGQTAGAGPLIRVGDTLFARAPGGAPANVAAACAALGIRAGFAGKVGADERGRFLAERVAAAGVDLTGLVVDPAYTTTAAFARIDPASGELAYAFDRNPGADTMLRTDELDFAALAAATIVHVGTFSLTAEPSRTATFTAVDAARTAGNLVSSDVNLRPLAWPNQSAMLDAAMALVSKSDLLKVSVSELELLCRMDEPAGIGTPTDMRNPGNLGPDTSLLLAHGPRLVAVTCGERGAYLATRTACAWIPAFPVTHVADTAGAGDAFWGAVLTWLLREGAVLSPDHIDCLTSDDLFACGRFACAAASCSVEKRGALGSAPTTNQVVERLGCARQV